MKREKLILIGLMFLGVPACFAAQEVQIKKVPKNPIPSTKPHAPARMNVEAWVDGSCLTVTFQQPEGDASITFESTIPYSEDETVYTTTSPIVIDLTPYGDVFSFTIVTESGNTYIGTF